MRISLFPVFVSIVALVLSVGCIKEDTGQDASIAIEPVPAVTPVQEVAPVAPLETVATVAPDETSSTLPETSALEEPASGDATPTPGAVTFSILRRNVEIMQDDAQVQLYADKLSGKMVYNWVGRVVAHSQSEGKDIVEVDMNYENTPLDQSVSEVVLMGFSQEELQLLPVGKVINFSGVIEGIETINERKNQFVLGQVEIFGLTE